MVGKNVSLKKQPGQGTRWGEIYPRGLVREYERVETRNAGGAGGGRVDGHTYTKSPTVVWEAGEHGVYAGWNGC